MSKDSLILLLKNCLYGDSFPERHVYQESGKRINGVLIATHRTHTRPGLQDNGLLKGDPNWAYTLQGVRYNSEDQPLTATFGYREFAKTKVVSRPRLIEPPKHEWIDWSERTAHLWANDLTYEQYLGSAHWQEVSSIVREKNGGRCVDCNRHPAQNAHHNSYANMGDITKEPDDCNGLCVGCHAQRHGKASFRLAA